MSATTDPVIGHCRKCHTEIRQSHPHVWCDACNEPITDEVNLKRKPTRGDEPGSPRVSPITVTLDRPSIENSLSSWGVAFLVIGILAGLSCFWLAGTVTKRYSVDSWGENGISWLWIGLGVGFIVQGMFTRVLLETGAEVIRLLRRMSK